MNKSKALIRSALATLLVAALVMPGRAGDSDFSMSKIYPIDSGHSFIGFQVKYMGYAKVHGRFEDFSGSVYYDPDDISRTSATVVIKTKSVDTDLAWRDKDLRSENWFDAQKYPSIMFQTTRVEQEKGRTLFHGDLTIRDVTREAVIEMQEHSGIVSDARSDSQIIFTGTTTVNRNDFGVRGERWSRVREGMTAVAAEVEIELTVLGKQIKEPNFRNWVRDTTRAAGRIYKKIAESGVEAGLTAFDEMRRDPGRRTNSNALNVAGYMLLKEGRTDDAILVFKRNVAIFPDEANLFDSLAEACATAGQFKKAAQYYRKVLEHDPYNGTAIELLRHLGD